MCGGQFFFLLSPLRSLASAMADQTALFKQYETDYCNKSTEISRKISAVPSLIGGERCGLRQHKESSLALRL